MNDEELKAAINESAKREKGPIELAFETFERSMEEKMREEMRHYLHGSRQNKEFMELARNKHDESKLALSKALWDAQKALTEQTTSAWPVPLDLKSLAMSLYPRSKL